MRTEQEIMNVVLHTAQQDERIRAVCLNGSRTNPNAPKDIFQDFDVVYLVTETDSFIRNLGWIDGFGERIILQTPDDRTLFPSGKCSRYSYLMQFTDGNRIDLTLIPLDEQEAYLKEDKLTVILMDKDQRLPQIPAPTDEDYWVKKPSAANFAACCNEFWWVSTYVAKGLWRQEMLYAQEHLHSYVRPMLIRMLEWQAGIDTDFSISTGKCGKYLENYLSEQSWQELLSTYPEGSYESVWNALFAMGTLFRRTALDVANRLHFEYREEENRRVTAYLNHIRHLPHDAAAIY